MACGKKYFTYIKEKGRIRFGVATCDGVGELPLCKRCSLMTKEKNPAHTCMGMDCNKYLGHRGFCSTKCHDSHYDGYDSFHAQ